MSDKKVIVGGYDADPQRRCEGKTTRGRLCRQPALVGSHFCPWHDPGVIYHPSARVKRIRERDAQRGASALDIRVGWVGEYMRSWSYVPAAYDVRQHLTTERGVSPEDAEAAILEWERRLEAEADEK